MSGLSLVPSSNKAAKLAANEGVAEAKQVTGLDRVGLIVQERRKWLDRIRIVAALVFDKTDIEANTRHFGVEFLGFVKLGEGLFPIFAAHGDYTDVGAGGGGARIDL